MSENMVGFIIWAVVGLVIMGIGVSDFFSKKAVGFWANINVEKVTDVKKYNCAVGILFIVYGLIFILLGTPMLNKQNSVLILFSVLGIMFETIVMMVVYTQVIAKKYVVK